MLIIIGFSVKKIYEGIWLTELKYFNKENTKIIISIQHNLFFKDGPIHPHVNCQLIFFKKEKPHVNHYINCQLRWQKILKIVT